MLPWNHPMSAIQGWHGQNQSGFNRPVKTGLNHLIKPTKSGQKWSKLGFYTILAFWRGFILAFSSDFHLNFQS